MQQFGYAKGGTLKCSFKWKGDSSIQTKKKKPNKKQSCIDKPCLKKTPKKQTNKKTKLHTYTHKKCCVQLLNAMVSKMYLPTGNSWKGKKIHVAMINM